MVKPYYDEHLTDNQWIRIFNPYNTTADDYVWHRDKNNRIFTVLDGDDWKIQFDDELPTVINKRDTIAIPKMVYHRIIPGKNKLRIIINEDV